MSSLLREKNSGGLVEFSRDSEPQVWRTARRCARRQPGVTPLPQVPHARLPALGSRGPPDTSSLLRCASTPAPNSCHCARLARLVRSSLVTPPVLTHPGVLAAIQLFISPLPLPPPPLLSRSGCVVWMIAERFKPGWRRWGEERLGFAPHFYTLRVPDGFVRCLSFTRCLTGKERARPSLKPAEEATPAARDGLRCPPPRPPGRKRLLSTVNF